MLLVMRFLVKRFMPLSAVNTCDRKSKKETRRSEETEKREEKEDEKEEGWGTKEGRRVSDHSVKENEVFYDGEKERCKGEERD